MKASISAYAIDANVILRYLLHDVEDQWAKADALMRGMEEGKIQLLCDSVILAEVVWTLKSFYKLDPQIISQALSPLISNESFYVSDKDHYIHVLELYGASTRDWGDACACAAALEQCEGRLLSFDKQLSRVDGIQRMESI